MKNLSTIFAIIVLGSLASFAILWTSSPSKEKQLAQSVQGIRLVGRAVFYTASNSTKPNTLKIGDLLIGNNEQVFRVNEIRQSHTGAFYVVVSWKYITNYLSYEEYASEPYTNYKTVELNSFAFNKTLITEAELVSFYVKYSGELAENVTISLPMNSSNDNSKAYVNKAYANTDKTAIQENINSAKPYLRALSQQTQALNTVEIVIPEDFSKEDSDKLNDILSNVNEEN